jgi:hypothetical protein
VGSIYVVGLDKEDFDILYQHASQLSGKVEVRGDLVLFEVPYPTGLEHFRGFRYFDPWRHKPPIEAPYPDKVDVYRRVKFQKQTVLKYPKMEGVF